MSEQTFQLKEDGEILIAAPSNVATELSCAYLAPGLCSSRLGSALRVACCGYM